MSNSLRPHGIYSPWNSPGQNTGVGSLSLLQGIFNPGIKPRSPTLQVDSLPAELQGKPKNTGVGSLSLLQRIFPTQELNHSLLHCRQILHQLSYQGRPRKSHSVIQSKFKVLRTRGASDVNPNPRAGEDEKRVQLNGETEREKGVSLLPLCLLYSSHPQ